MQASVGHAEPKEKVGLKDGGHVILRCSNCDKGLVDIWIVKPDMPVEFDCLAKCCFCGDVSETVKIKGRFARSGYSTNETPEDPDAAKMLTLIDRIEATGDKVIFHTKKP